MFKKSNDLMPVTLLMSYLLLFVTVIILVVASAALPQQTDAEYYNQDTTQEIE